MLLEEIDGFSWIVAQSNKGESPEIVGERVERDVRRYRHQEEGKEDFYVQTFDDALATFSAIIGILNGALIIAVPIIVLFIVYSGFLFVTARGDTTKLATARLNFFYVIIGSVVLLGATAIAAVVANTIRSFGVMP